MTLSDAYIKTPTDKQMKLDLNFGSRKISIVILRKNTFFQTLIVGITENPLLKDDSVLLSNEWQPVEYVQ